MTDKKSKPRNSDPRQSSISIRFVENTYFFPGQQKNDIRFSIHIKKKLIRTCMVSQKPPYAAKRGAVCCMAGQTKTTLHCNGILSLGKLGFDYVATGNWVRAKWFAADGARPCGARGKVLRRSGQSLAASAANVK